MLNNKHNGIDSCEYQLQNDEEIFFEFDGVITQEKIIESVDYIKNKLINHNVEENKIHHIFEVIIEVMQNMLSYSVNSIDKGNNTYESKGKIVIIHNVKTQEYLVYSCNLIDGIKKEKISKNINQITNLNKDELKELHKITIKNRKTTHSRGAGLGLILMARKSNKPLCVNFKEIENNTFMFNLQISLEG